MGAGAAQQAYANCADFRLPTGELWVPSPRAQRIIDRLVSATRPVR